MSFPHEGLDILTDRGVAMLQEDSIKGADQVKDVNPFLVSHTVGVTPAINGEPGDWSRA
ncbi:hypothetical protein [Gluconobacter kondonii]|uniref:hypothetical protein n=1 Tax=Gluconobacter kondonii TaxID=941463 RepID=UPI001B8BAEE1|nr:hypothetical protein [Gluconobacter kondonii]MBS1056101.1 hypothetical protein [Gluconobacter kondonii]